MKKLTLVFSLILLISSSLFSQAYVQVGTGTVSSSYPVLWNNAHYAMILTHAELGDAKSITKIAIQCTNGPKTVNSQKIYLKQTSLSLFPSASYDDPIAGGYTLVYDGPITFNGWTELTLISPFSYNGTDNLIVQFEHRGNYESYASFNSTTSTINDNKGASTGAASFPSSACYLNPPPSSRLNIRFYYPTPVNPATSPFPTENSIRVSLNTDLQFNLDATDLTYDVFFGTTVDPTTKIVSDATAIYGLNTVPFSAINGGNLLSSKSDYYWKVVAKNGANSTSTSVYKFTTQKMLSSFPYTQNFTQDINDPNIVFYPGWYGDLTKTDWTYASSPTNWSCYQVGPNPNYTDYYGYISPFSLTQGESYSLTSPRFDLSAGNYQISFDWMNGTVTGKGEEKVVDADKTYFEASTDGGTTWNTISTFYPATAQTTFQSHIASLPSGNNVRLRWRYEVINSANSPKSFYFDNIVIQATSANPIISLSENNYTFKNLFLNGKTTHDIIITNMSAVNTLEISNASVTGAFSCNVSNLSILPGQAETVTVTYEPTVAGANQTGTITFNTNSATGDNVLNVTGTGLANLGSFFETFETIDPNIYAIPENWNQISNYPTDLFHFVQVQNDGGGRVLRMYNNSDITSPLIAITPGANNFATNTLTFFAYSSSGTETLQIGLMDDPYNASSFVPVGTPITLTLTMTQYTVTFNAANIKPYIAFKHGGVSTTSSIRINDVKWENTLVVSVPEPASVVYPETVSADIDIMNQLIAKWTPGLGTPTGYKISLGTNEANPTQILNNVDINNVTSYSFSNLNFATTYYWKIVPYNAQGDAVNCPVWNFATMADPTVSTFPWNDGFETVNDHFSGNNIFRYPMGWSLENNNEQNMCWDKIANTGTSQTNAHTGVQAMNLWAGFAMQPMDDWFFTPPMDLTANHTYKLKFWYKAAIYQGTTFEKMKVVVGTDNTSASMTGVELFNENNITITDYTEVSANFTASQSGVKYIGFNGYSDALQWILFLDDVSIEDLGILNNVNELNSEISIYPNPSNGNFTISSNNILSTGSTLKIYNVLGTEVYSRQIQNLNEKISINSLEKGIYFLKIKSNGKEFINKIVVK